MPEISGLPGLSWQLKPGPGTACFDTDGPDHSG